MLPTDYHTTCLKSTLSIYRENRVTLPSLVNYTNSLMKITLEYNGSKTSLSIIVPLCSFYRALSVSLSPFADRGANRPGGEANCSER